MALDYMAFRRTSQGWNMERSHFHDQYELLLTLSGEAEMFVTNRCYPLQRGTLMLFSPVILHRSVAQTHPYERCVMRFSRQYADSLSTDTTDLLRIFSDHRVRFQLSEDQTVLLSRLYDDCINEYRGFGSDWKHRMAFVNLLLHVDQIVGQMSGASEEPHAQMQGTIAAILTYIQDHLSDDLSLDALASHFYISKPHLCRLFKEHTGFPPGEYIIQSRILFAKTLLQEGCSVQKAGMMSGFHSYPHFIRTFRQLTGISPGKYKSTLP